ncbi:hypothetical protein [Planctobacterium marinum]|uniref:hypothetical protein n=1 Tax=Planctobacterium marinum TaxID=1631968 RepID=UPI001E556128|nr:hypothetical protein [Planctobacterium marinum]MCC2606840.1 hypothetical protein [Planctobacterium marinum]
MMRLIKHLIMLAMAIAALWVIVQTLLSDSGLQRVSQPIPDSVKLDISRSYILPPDTHLDYRLTQSPQKLWISSAAILSGADNKTARYPYHLKVQVLDSRGNILFENQFHHHALATRKVELKANQQLVPEAFLNDSNARLAAMENLHITLPEGASRLVISQIVKSDNIKEVAVRAYQHVQRSSRVKPIDLWQRLSVKQKDNLLQYYPFDTAFLSDTEKANLAEYRWQPLVPSGDEDQDYQSVLIYRVPLTDIATKKHLLSQYEHHADAYKQVSFPIEVAGQYRIAGEHAFTDRAFKLHMSWFNLEDSLEQKRSFTYTGKQFSQRIALKPGLVSFTSSVPLSLALFAESGYVQEHDHFANTVILSPGKPLRFSLSQGDSELTPYKVQVRAFAEQSLSTGPNALVDVRVLTDSQQLQQHSIHPEFVPEKNNQLANEEFFNWLGQKQELYLQVSKAAQFLELSSSQPVLVSVFTRLSNMPSMRTLPEEKRDWFDYPAGVPDWFAMRPDSWEQEVNLGNIRLLKNYHDSLLDERPEVDPDETYQTLLDDFSTLTLSDIMVENPYPGQPVALEENSALNFASLTTFPHFASAEKLSKPVAGRLFFNRDSARPVQITWRKNDVPQPPFWIAGQWGLVDESVMGGSLTGTIALDAPDVQWWRNGLPRQASQWQQRRALLVTSGDTVQLNNTKQSTQEMLSFVLYQTTPEPVILDIEIQDASRNPNINTAHTLLKRRYQINATERYNGYQLSGKRTIIGRQTFSLLLDEDISNSAHRIQLSHQQGDEVYVSIVKRVIQPTPIIERYRNELEH